MKLRIYFNAMNGILFCQNLVAVGCHQYINEQFLDDFVRDHPNVPRFLSVRNELISVPPQY
ncbi:UNVERIFIED_CONTAM: hypothetical protein NCL1_33442 [Trichonephila clavipes]